MHTLPDHPADADAAAALEEAVRRGIPFLAFCDGDGRQHIVGLDGRKRTYTIGRRDEADIPLGWDREVSRLHATLERLAGEWTVTDDGLSQNGTFVNEIRIVGRRRLGDGDMLRVGRTAMTFRQPASASHGVTMLPGELSVTTALSDQQHSVIRELCRPLMTDGDEISPAGDEAIAAALRIPVPVVENEIQALAAAFGFDDLPPIEARAEVALGAIRTGLVRFDDFRA